METIKILGIIQDGDGSKYHRISYGIGKLHNTEIEGKKVEVTLKEFDENTLKDAENYDILIYHWDLPATIQELSVLQSKGVKIIYQIDDAFKKEDYSILHPYQNEGRYSPIQKEQLVKMHLLNSDCIITTTGSLAKDCYEFNENVAIIPNFLNPEDFKKREKTVSDKLRVAIIGSYSHYPDYLMLKQVINRLAKNSIIAKNIEFSLCGIDSNNSKWQEIINLFKVKKNLNFTTKEFLPVDKYLEFYNECDIVLLPLENTNFNIKKSALKLAECAITNTLPVGSSLYSGKELRGIVVAESPLEVEQSLLKLLDKEYYNQVLKYVTEVNLKDNDYNKRFEDTLKVINTVYSEDLSSKLEDVKLWSIIYDNENQIAEYEKCDNSGIRTVEQKSYLFEWNAILDIIDNKLENEDYLGIFSWKLGQRTGFTKNILLKSLKFYNYKDYDVINLTPNYKELNLNYYNWTNNYHPTFLDKFTKVCNHVGLEVKEPKTVVISNMVIAKKEIYKDFVNNYAKKAIDFMHENFEEFNENAHYGSGLPAEELEKFTGMQYYNFFTFVLERMWSAYIESNSELKVKNLL